MPDRERPVHLVIETDKRTVTATVCGISLDAFPRTTTDPREVTCGKCRKTKIDFA